MILAPLMIAAGLFTDRIPVSFPKEVVYPPLFKLGDGRLSVRFRAQVRHGHFTATTCLEPQKADAKWLMKNTVRTAQVALADDAQPRIFEVRFCSVSFNAEYPTTYSFWRRSTTEVSK